MDLIHLNRRRVLAAIGSSTAALLLPGALARAAQGPAGPPVARKEPVRESLWGEEIVDPYRWMENPKDAEWESFMKGQAAHARRTLDAIPGRKALYRARDTAFWRRADRARAADGGDRAACSTRCGPPAANQFKLYMRDGVNGAERLLIDPSTLRGPNDVHMSLDWWAASPDGRYVVYGLSRGRLRGVGAAHVLTSTPTRCCDERIDRTQFGSPSWLPDSKAFFYNRLAEGAKQGTHRLLPGLRRLAAPDRDRPEERLEGPEPWTAPSRADGAH